MNELDEFELASVIIYSLNNLESHFENAGDYPLSKKLMRTKMDRLNELVVIFIEEYCHEVE